MSESKSVEVGTKIWRGITAHADGPRLQELRCVNGTKGDHVFKAAAGRGRFTDKLTTFDGDSQFGLVCFVSEPPTGPWTHFEITRVSRSGTSVHVRTVYGNPKELYAQYKAVGDCSRLLPRRVVATGAEDSRPYAGVFDLRVNGLVQHNSGPYDPDYIGGSSGINWWEYFEDAETGEIYKVYCCDGVNYSKDALSPDDTEWLHECYDAIVARCAAQARTQGPTDQSPMYVSRNERAIMQSFSHTKWLASLDDKCDGKQSNEGLEGGFVGYCRGIPVICDLARKDQLSPRKQRENDPE